MLKVNEFREQVLSSMGDLSDSRRAIADYVAIHAAMIRGRIPDEKNDHLRLLKDGKFYGAQPLPKRYAYGEMKQCFLNSARLALQTPGLTYCEGVALAIIPTHHAWCIDTKGRVIDPTWRTRENDPHGHNPGEMAYLGITFEMGDVTRMLTQVGSCLFDWRRLSLDSKQ